MIGSGATAITLVPEMAKTAAHVTMVQRSPSYIVALPSQDPIAEWLKRRLPAALAYRLVRVKNVLLTMLFFNLARRWPQQMKARLIGLAARRLGPDHDVATLHTALQPVGSAPLHRADADVFRAISEAARRSSPTRSTASPSAASASIGREIEADLVSPRPG